jgi:fructokinase
MFDITAMGELLFDFSLYGNSERGNHVYEANPGGAPANVIVGAQKLGAKTAFIGKIGDDLLSSELKETLKRHGVNTSGLVESAEYNTPLAFVQLDKNGDRSFTFYRNNSADCNITNDDIDLKIIQDSKIFHFGSLTMTDQPSRSATLYAAKVAHDRGLTVSFDPNIRSSLWRSKEEMIETIKSALQFCDILKISDYELSLITNSKNIKSGMQLLQEQYGIKLIFTTLGADGCEWYYNGYCGKMPSYDVKTIDTTGAGDSFIAAILYKISCLNNGLESLCQNELTEIARFASAASSLTTTISGAIPSLPAFNQVEDLIKRTKI